MKTFALSLLSLSLLLAGCQQATNTATEAAALPAGVSLVKDASKPVAAVAIPYKKYRLSNGLTVIVHEDASDPLVHVDVTYHVGSAREEPGKSGFAHFFEHMMFQGSEHVADEQHFQIITEAGGEMNGSTNTDRTNYYQTVPVNQLEKVLWLESDRMGFLLNAVTEKKFEVQRETVKNERGQSVDNRPYGRLSERVDQAFYPDGHPYSWPVIGHMADLNRANVNDVKAFFLRWYGPNNATLTIGGAVKAEQILPLVQQYFGAIPQGPEVTPAAKPLVTLTQDRYISMEDNVHLPLLYMAFPTVYVRHADEAPLDILAEILGGGNNSLLYKNLVKTQKAVQAQSGHGCQELACEFTLLALPAPGAVKSLAETEQQIRQSLAEFEQRGVTDDDLNKVKAKMEAASIFGLQSVEGKVSQLALNETFFGEPDLTAADLARYQSVSKADVERVYQQYLKGKAAVIMSVVPKGQRQLIAKADNFTPVQHDFGGPSTTKAEDLQLRPVKDNLDRSKIPQAGANPAIELPTTWQQSLSNGIRVLGAQSQETPTTSLLLRIPLGLYDETPAQVGISQLLAALLDEGTLLKSTEQMSLALEKLGSSISFSAGDEYLEVSVQSLSKNLPQTLELLMEKLLLPGFNPQDFERLRQQTLQGIQHAEKDAGFMASHAVQQLMYGDHISAYPNQGTLQSVSTLTLADVKAYARRLFKPGRAELILVSDLPQTQVLAELQPRLQRWQGDAAERQVQIPDAIAKAGTIYLIDKPDAPQSEIRIVKRSLSRDFTGEYFRAGLMNFVLGGNFNSRINLNLREDKGYTYGARSGFSADRYAGLYSASAAVRADVTAASIAEFYKEISRYQQQGMTPQELEFMRKAINQSDALAYETPGAKLGFMAAILQYQLAADFTQQRNQIVRDITLDELNQLAKRHLDPASFSVVVVGPAKEIRPQLDQLETLGLKVQDYKF
ncbi:M16 family metallopeptidase [Rheinheimera texasensis]|uniref:M16 family metallopeptidase n=1 Tax=Rheinheimera texasensis TaxID=306205 RepID=UPI0004E0C418|nr:pitrilysin family protein [Rheinheimera texasensis]